MNAYQLHRRYLAAYKRLASKGHLSDEPQMRMIARRLWVLRCGPAYGVQCFKGLVVD